MHAIQTMSPSHVGLGSDFDGMLSGPEGLDDVSAYPDLVAELLRRGLSEDDVSQVCGLNVIRVWKEVERVASVMQSPKRDLSQGEEGLDRDRAQGSIDGKDGSVTGGDGGAVAWDVMVDEIGDVWTPAQREMVERTGKERMERRKKVGQDGTDETTK